VKAFFSSNCRVCTIVRIHIALVLGVLAAWRLRPEWFEFLRDVAVQHLAAFAVLLVFLIILAFKTFQHYRRGKPGGLPE
jgi:Na+/serine symporter